MKVAQAIWTAEAGWQAAGGPDPSAGLVLYFAGQGVLADGRRIAEIRQRFPNARLVGCTTGGEIQGEDVHDGSLVLAALSFDRSTVRVDSERIADRAESFRVGAALAGRLAGPALKWVFVLSDGIGVNGSELVRGLAGGLAEDVVLSGGLAADGDAFVSTLVGADDTPAPGQVAAVGVYGAGLTVRHGSFGGWDVFGPERSVTRSRDNLLHEIDGEPALDLYERYLGAEAAQLPGSALLFPLRIRDPHDRGPGLVRTVVGIDRDSRAMIFAGDVPTGWSAQLMRGSFEHLLEGAGRAAAQIGPVPSPSLALLVSCIGRKLLLGQRVAEEVEHVRQVLGAGCPTVGFYSYGEIGPQPGAARAGLHNQTMTITVIGEV